MKSIHTTPDGLIVVTKAATAPTHKLDPEERKARRQKNNAKKISNQRRRRAHGRTR